MRSVGAVTPPAAQARDVRVDEATSSARVSALFEAESVNLLGYFLRRVDDRDDAADLVGETALALWRRATNLPTDAVEARMWMYGIARRTLATHRRGSGRRLALADRLRSEVSLSRPEPDPRLDDVVAAVRTLASCDQELIGLVHWEGFTVTEAAAMLGIRAGTAQMRYLRARGRLRSALES